MAPLKNRLADYSLVSDALATLNDQSLAVLVAKSAPMGSGIGGTSASVEVSGIRVFLKKIRLTDIERLPENFMSTANLFGLPTYYQYGIGSAGFGAWRELSAHKMTTEWVLNGECPNFPLMYHWRVLPAENYPPTSEQSDELESTVSYWEGSPAIRNRLAAQLSASAEIVLFLEYFPMTLETGLDPLFVASVERDLKSTTSFMSSRGFIHFDAHFRNILTDGEHSYFSDFGLALSNRFELSKSELDFFGAHRDFDRHYTSAYLANWIAIRLFGAEKRDEALNGYAAGKYKGALAPWAESILTRDARKAIAMKTFLRKLEIESKSTPYPASDFTD